MFHTDLGHSTIRLLIHNPYFVCFKTYHFVFVSILVDPVYSSSGGQETWALVAPPHSLVAGQQACKLKLGNKPLICCFTVESFLSLS